LALRGRTVKICRFKAKNLEKFGILSHGKIKEIQGDLFNPGSETGRVYKEEEVELLPPVNPGKIICIGFNYRKHAKDFKEIATKKPTIALKSPNSTIGCNQNILLPDISDRVDHEAELGIIIGKEGYRIENPEEHILGYTIVNDVTARDLQHEMGQWSPSKSFPTFCPMGPYVNTDLDPSSLRIRCRVNDKLRQDAKTSDMIYSPDECVRFVSRFMKLERGDLIATGTVPCVGKLGDGDVVEIEIEKIGKLKNFVKAEKHWLDYTKDILRKRGSTKHI